MTEPHQIGENNGPRIFSIQ